MKNTALLLILFCSVAALAAGAEHGSGHGEEHIPFKQIGWQAANLGILLVALFFFIRKSIVEVFQNRQKEYLSRAEKTKSALRNAEEALAGIKEKLTRLESGEKKSLESARVEAEILKANIIKDAEQSAQKIKKDASHAINNELSKARAEINSMILNKAMASVTKTMIDKNQTGTSTQEAQFVKQLEQVRV